ncbi:MAG: hypothetical protein LBR73_09910 [Oscillospiraceae bacterium]|nr:hypothetical protein [Oscillospiraceae bacterium]
MAAVSVILWYANSLNYFIYVWDRLEALLYVVPQLSVFSLNELNILLKICSIAAGGMAVFAEAAFFYWFAKKVILYGRGWFSESDQYERIYLICGYLFFIAFAVFAYTQTSAFYAPQTSSSGEGLSYDIVYTMDSPAIMRENSFISINAGENDFRNILFGLFSMPFALPLFGLSKVLFFIPNFYVYALAALQIAAVLVTIATIVRCIGVKGIAKTAALCLFSVSYSVLLNVLSFEQYVFSTMYLVLFLYACIHAQKEKEALLLMAGGSLLTSFAASPLILQGKSPLRWLRQAGRICLSFIGVFILFGQVPMLSRAAALVQRYGSFVGGALPFADRLKQFLRFVASVFVQPPAGIVVKNDAVTYQMYPVLNYSVLGIVLLALAVFAAVYCHRHRFAVLCGAWVTFSFVVLCLIGWGTAENGLILYSLYFGWSYTALLVLLAEKLLARFYKIRAVLYLTAALAAVSVNLPALIDMIYKLADSYPA